MKQIKVNFEGREVEALSEYVNGTLWIHAEGRTFSVEAPSKKKKRHRAGGASAGGGEIEAPMPGKVTKILKTASSAVQIGDAVLVMEAMKMEYTLKADVAGTIQEISCSVGEQVALGQVLVRIQPESEKQ